MFSRVTLLEVDTVRADVEHVLERYLDEILPELQRQPGYEGELVMVNPDGRGVIVSLWRTREDLEASATIATGAVESFMTVFRAPPGRDSYEVRVIDLPAHALD